MRTQIQSKIQNLREKLAEAKAELKATQDEYKKTHNKAVTESKKANKLERASDKRFSKLWDALDKKQNVAHDKIWKDSETADAAEEKLHHKVGNLNMTVKGLNSQIQDSISHVREENKRCPHCNKIKPQSPDVCHCK